MKRGCLIAIAVVLAVGGAVAAAFGPGALRRARTRYAPISRMKADQADFEAWTRQKAWAEPATAAVTAEKLDAFLALRRDLRRLEGKSDDLRRRGPARGERARLRDVPTLMEGVGGLMSERFAAFRKHDIAPAEYEYLENLVYSTWLGGIAAEGDDPAARERAAHEIDQTAARESAPAVRARLQQVAAGLRSRTPAAPQGISEDLHRLLLSRVDEIQAQPTGHVATRLPRPRPAPETPAATTSP